MKLCLCGSNLQTMKMHWCSILYRYLALCHPWFTAVLPIGHNHSVIACVPYSAVWCPQCFNVKGQRLHESWICRMCSFLHTWHTALPFSWKVLGRPIYLVPFTPNESKYWVHGCIEHEWVGFGKERARCREGGFQGFLETPFQKYV